MNCRRVVTAVFAAALLAPTAPIAADPPKAGAEPVAQDAAGRRAAERLGLRVADGERIEITADELEVRDTGGSQRIVFDGHVRVVQGSMTIHSDRLVATYPENAGGHPSRIVATGSVRILQEGVEVRCTEAVYDDRLGRIHCSSAPHPAQLKRGTDVVTGREIEFDLRAGILKVRGRATVQIEPRKQLPGGPSAVGTPGESAQ
jgi:lipopolysaccharide transport protein LptA